MRFQVGQIVVAYRFIITKHDGSVVKTTSNIFRNQAESVKYDFILLECIEHHKVPIAYSDGEGDGFIFKDDQGNIFNNQYPTASYGQISDDNDRIFTRYGKAYERFSYALFSSYVEYVENLLGDIYETSRQGDSEKNYYDMLKKEFFNMVNAYIKLTGDRPKFKVMERLDPKGDEEKYFFGLFEMI